MSIKLMTEAWGTSGLNASQKLVLLSICDYANDDGYCWPRIKVLAEKCDISERAVQYNISRLIELGILEAKTRLTRFGTQGSNLYRVLLGGGEADCTLENTTFFMGGGEASCTGGVKPVAPLIYEPSIEPSKTKRRVELDLFGSVEPLPPVEYFPPSRPQNRFEEFWKNWPDRSQPKQPAKKAWDKILAKKYNYDVQDYIIKALENQKQSKKHLGKKDYLPHASTWLNQERWLDEVQVELEELYVR